MPTWIVENMVTVKVFKKSSQSGQLYLYLGERDYISSDGLIDDINGIAYVPNLDQMEGKKNYFFLYIWPSRSPLKKIYVWALMNVTKQFGNVFKNHNYFNLLKWNLDPPDDTGYGLKCME